MQGLVRNQPGIVNHRNGLGRAFYNLGNVYGIDLGQRKEAMENFEQARAIQQSLVQENPTVGEYQYDLARTCGQIGAFQRFFRPVESLLNFEHARDLLQALVRDHPRVTRYSVDMVFTEFQIGDRQIDFGRFPEALVSLERGRDLCELLVRETPSNFEMRDLLVSPARKPALNSGGMFSEPTTHLLVGPCPFNGVGVPMVVFRPRSQDMRLEFLLALPGRTFQVIVLERMNEYCCLV